MPTDDSDSEFALEQHARAKKRVRLSQMDNSSSEDEDPPPARAGPSKSGLTYRSDNILERLASAANMVPYLCRKDGAKLILPIFEGLQPEIHAKDGRNDTTLTTKVPSLLRLVLPDFPSAGSSAYQKAYNKFVETVGARPTKDTSKESHISFVWRI